MTTTSSNWRVINGSTGAIGEEFARKLAARGNALVLLNPSERKTKTQSEEILAGRSWS